MSTCTLAGAAFNPDSFTEVVNTVAKNVVGELAYYGVTYAGDALGLDPRVSYLAGIGIRSSLRAGLSGPNGGGSPGDWIDGAIAGLSQGITSVALNYAVEEMDIDPLLANIGFSAIAGAIEASLSTDFQTGETGLFEKMFEIYEKNALTFLGADIEPDDYWGQAAYAANIMNFTDIIREHGLETALNTYATSFFNSTAVNSIVTAGYTIGGYFAEKLAAGEIETVTLDTGETVDGIRAEGTETILLFDSEGNVVGIKDPDKLIYGDLGIDATGEVGLLNGYLSGEYVPGLGIYMDLEGGNQTYAEIRDTLTGETLYYVTPRENGGYIYYDSFGDMIDGIIENPDYLYEMSMDYETLVKHRYSYEFEEGTDFSWINLVIS